MSAKVFGDYPDRLAYPDVFFSILSIPLFYLFLKIYFSKNLSLSITAVYAVSAYFIHSSRFAWNSNLIPFFVLLFLVSLYEFFKDNEKTSWLWVISLGVALGVGFQLHAIIMALFSIIVFVMFVFSMKRNYMAWKKWVVVVLVFLVCNSGQIINEMTTNFSNSKRLVNFSFKNSGNDAPESRLAALADNAGCHIEANFFFLFSYGSDVSPYGSNICSYEFTNDLPKILEKSFSKIMKEKIYLIVLLVSFLSYIIGYSLLIYYNIKEEGTSKKYFLRLIALYAGILYLITIPLSAAGQFSDLRYFTPIFFMPFVFLGFLVKFMSEKLTKIYIIPAIIIFSLLLWSNVTAISAEAKPLLAKNRTCSSNIPTLGELNSVTQYIASQSNGEKNIYVDIRNKELSSIKPLMYLLEKGNLNPIRITRGTIDVTSADHAVFFISCESMPEYSYGYQQIGNFYVYQITNKKK
jgi:4-amino-4-deoxy-L-arabinose transferase-like glycosyltransferase